MSIVDAALIVAMTGLTCLLVGLALVWTWRQLKPIWDAEREYKALRAHPRNRRKP